MGNGMSVVGAPSPRGLPQHGPSIPEGTVIPLTGGIQNAMKTSIMGKAHRVNTQLLLGKEMKHYVWKVKGDEVVPDSASSSTTSDIFTAQHCPQDDVVAINNDTQVVLTVAFTGCAFFIARFEGQDIVGHFDNSDKPHSYTPLSQFIMEQKSSTIETLIQQLPAYALAENKEKFVQEKKNALQSALNGILQAEIVGHNSPNDHDYYVFPHPFSMRSGCPHERVGSDTDFFGVTNAAFVREHDGSWSLLIQTYRKGTNPHTSTPLFDSLYARESQNCHPLELFPLYQQGVRAAGLEEIVEPHPPVSLP